MKWQSIVAVVVVIVFVAGYAYVKQPREPKEAEVKPSETVEEGGEIYVDVKGAVVRPGLLKVKDGTRVFAVIEAAGGITKDADVSGLNEAAKVSDGTMLYVPRKGEEEEKHGAKVNVNKATALELEALPGIGPAKAAAIVEERKKHGLFTSVADLDRVAGFGPKTIERLTPYVEVGP